MSKPSPVAIDWIGPLAEPYLRGCRPRRQSSGALRGWWFYSRAGKSRRGSRGFFVGYLLDGRKWKFASPDPPECLVFAFVQTPKSAAHRRLVTAKGSPVRKIFEYIRWLTHRAPRFQFFEEHLPAMLRHTSMRDWPAARREHFSRNFFIETLALLVRSGLVKRLASANSRMRQPS